MAEERIDPALADQYPPNIQAILKAPSSASAALGLELIAIDRAAMSARMAFNAGDHLCNKWGALQGGMVAAMLDDAISIAVGLTLEWGEISPTLELKTSFIAAAKPGRYLADGWVVMRGKSVAFIEARLMSEDGEIVATASSTARLVKIKR